MMLYDLSRDIRDPLRSIHLVTLGDSVTWGSSVPGMDAPSGSPDLTQTRNNLTCRSWVNILSDWLHLVGTDWQGWNSPEAGSSSSARQIDVTAGDPRLRVVRYTAGTLDPSATPLNIPPGHALEWTMTGSQFYVVYRTQTTDQGVTFALYHNGALRGGAQSTYGNGALAMRGYGVVFNTWTVQVRNLSPTTPLAIESVKMTKSVRVDNRAISGQSSAVYHPSNPVLAQAVPPGATHVAYMIGINDRAMPGGVRRPSELMRANVASTLDWLAINRPMAKICLLTPPASYGIREMFDSPTLYGFPVSESAYQLRSLADSYGIDCVDIHGLSQRFAVLNDIFSTDLQHPNAAGHAAIAQTMIERIT